MGVTQTKVAFIGAGNMAREHIKAFSSLEGVTLAGIHSRTREKSEALAKEFGITHICDSIQDLHDTTGADLVIVTVSVAAMFKVSCEAAAYDWALLLEKPPAIDLKQAQELEAIMKKNGRDAYVVLNRRFLSSTLAAQESLNASDKPRFIHVQDQQPLEKIKAMNIHPENVIENWMYANSIHLIDYFSSFCRGNVTGIKILSPWQGVEATELVLAHVEYDSGDKGIYECRMKGPGPWAATISTEDIRWELKPLEHAAYINDGDRTVHTVEKSTLDQEYKPGFVVQAQHVVNAVQGTKNNAPTLSGCIKTMDLISKIYA